MRTPRALEVVFTSAAKTLSFCKTPLAAVIFLEATVALTRTLAAATVSSMSALETPLSCSARFVLNT